MSATLRALSIEPACILERLRTQRMGEAPVEMWPMHKGRPAAPSLLPSEPLLIGLLSSIDKETFVI